jgi:pimeloyl-ACP methyl ester carboxylesterase
VRPKPIPCQLALAESGVHADVRAGGRITTAMLLRCAAKHTVLAPDLRGLGDTTKPATGYDKATVAGDIRALVAKLGLGTRAKN